MSEREQVPFSMTIEYVELMHEWKRASYFQYGYRIYGTHAGVEESKFLSVWL